jgi:aldose sugar dehydrogenase
MASIVTPNLFVWSVPVGPTALAFLNSSALGKGYQDDLFVGNINNGSIFHFELNDQMNGFVLEDPLDDKVADSPYENNDLIFASGFGGITDIQGA